MTRNTETHGLRTDIETLLDRRSWFDDEVAETLKEAGYEYDIDVKEAGRDEMENVIDWGGVVHSMASNAVSETVEAEYGEGYESYHISSLAFKTDYNQYEIVELLKSRDVDGEEDLAELDRLTDWMGFESAIAYVEG